MDIKRLIKSNMIKILFQPIHNFKSDIVIGYEALARGPEGSSIEGARSLFRAAKQSGLQIELEMHCFRKALYEFRSKMAGDCGLLFVNFHPEILADNCDEILYELDGLRERTVIEINESHSRIRCISGQLNRLKDKRVKVALDDIGAGDRSLSNLCETRVDYLKIDK
ncbi:MAG: EAL domain-containing protein, partial [Peptococcaceae bacterium]|nr:EAL domain-containing protein [Peptococcaceae bacterium]